MNIKEIIVDTYYDYFNFSWARSILHVFGIHKWCGNMRPCQQPRPMSIVRLEVAGTCKEYDDSMKDIFGDSHYIFLGDIPNMPCHCVLFDPDGGEIIPFYHTDNFKEVPEDEL